METKQDEMNLDEQWWEVFCLSHIDQNIFYNSSAVLHCCA